TILRIVTSTRHADIPIATGDDWKRVSSVDSKYFPPSCSEYEKPKETEWDKKKYVCIFRGKNTGAGLTIDTNPRLKAAYLSNEGRTWNDLNPDYDDDSYVLDLGIISWDGRIRYTRTGL